MNKGGLVILVIILYFVIKYFLMRYYGDVKVINILSIAGIDSKYKLYNSKPAGYCAGLWHGLIAPIIFIISMFDISVCIYETNNTGRGYNIGFMTGISSSINIANYTH